MRRRGKSDQGSVRDCDGAGRVREEKKISVKIPAGVDDGSRLRVAGEGEAGFNGGPAGDLYVFISVREHREVHAPRLRHPLRTAISFTQAALGAEVQTRHDRRRRVAAHPAPARSRARSSASAAKASSSSTAPAAATTTSTSRCASRRRSTTSSATCSTRYADAEGEDAAAGQGRVREGEGLARREITRSLPARVRPCSPDATPRSPPLRVPRVNRSHSQSTPLSHKIAARMLRTVIAATGSYIPPVRVPNSEFLNHDFRDRRRQAVAEDER